MGKDLSEKAFTLVELIVVITILAILWTISFISIQGYSVSARNSKRISDIAQLYQKILIETIKWVDVSNFVSNPQNKEIIFWWAPHNVIVWEINFDKLNENASSFKAPNWEKYLIAYSKWDNNNDFIQLISKKEAEDWYFIKGSYHKLNEITDWDNLFFWEDDDSNHSDLLAMITNQETEKSTNIITPSSCNWIWEIIYNTGTRFKNPKNLIKYDTSIWNTMQALNAWKYCDTDDLIVCTWIWNWIQMSACNLWAINATQTTSTEISDYLENNAWLLFQWLINIWVDQQSNYELPDNIFLNSIKNWTWLCPTNRHIPHPEEWYTIVEAWNQSNPKQWILWTATDMPEYYHPTNSRYNWSWQMPIFIQKLYLPAIGRRLSTNILNGQGGSGSYWSSLGDSSIDFTYFSLTFYAPNIRPGVLSRNYVALSIRCFKD
jgi:prepilin-type N-terminal cleavage/methylation domain-containing protein